MRKVLCIILSAVMLLSMLALTACKENDKPEVSGTPTESIAPTESGKVSAEESATPEAQKEIVTIPLEPDYFRLLCENTSARIDQYSSIRQVYYNLITASPVTEETKFEVHFDQEVNFTFGCGNLIEYVTPDLDMLATYKYDDWIECAEAIKEGGIGAMRGFNFDTSSEGGGLYSYLIYLTFDSNQPKDEICLSKLTFSMDGRTQNYDIGSIVINFDSDVELSVDETFCVQTLAMTDVNAGITTDGWFEIPNFDVEILDDVIIKDIYTSDEDITLTKISVVQKTAEGDTINFLWDPEVDEPLEFYKGDAVTFYIEATNPVFANTLYAASKFHLIFSYGGELEGNIEYIDFLFRMRENPFWAYLQLECGKDALSYFTVYRPVENDAVEDIFD